MCVADSRYSIMQRRVVLALPVFIISLSCCRAFSIQRVGNAAYVYHSQAVRRTRSSSRWTMKDQEYETSKCRSPASEAPRLLQQAEYKSPWIHNAAVETQHKRDMRSQVVDFKRHVQPTATDVELRLIFDHLDADGSGTIDVFELAELAQVLGETWENDYIHSLISRIDLNGDGVISFEEFLAWHNSGLEADGYELTSGHKKRIYAYSQVLNVRFAHEASMDFPNRSSGKPQVPGFYLMRDYQRLMSSVDREQPEPVELRVQGAIPLALQGSYFVTGPGVLKQDGAHVHPFDGHGLVRKFQIDGQTGRVIYQSSFVRTPAFIDEAGHTPARPATVLTSSLIGALLPTAGMILTEAFKERVRVFKAKLDRLARLSRGPGISDMPVLKRGIGTNTQIWRNFLQISGLVPDRNPSNTCIIPIDNGKRLLSAYEGGLPFLMDGSTLETLGDAQSFGGALDGFFFLAHTRFDSESNRLVGLGVQQRVTTHLVHIELDATTLECKHRQEYSFPDLFYIHDIAITRSALVVTPVPMELNLKVLPSVLMGFGTFVSAITSRSKKLATAQADLNTVASHINYTLLRSIARMRYACQKRLGRSLPRLRRSKRAPTHQNSIILMPRPAVQATSSEPAKPARTSLREVLSAGPLRIPIANAAFGSAFHHVQAFEHQDQQGLILDTCMFSELDLLNPLGFAPKAGVYNPELNPDGQTLSRIDVNIVDGTAISTPLLIESRGFRGYGRAPKVPGPGRQDSGPEDSEAEGKTDGRLPLVCDFPATHPGKHGERCSYMYAVTSNNPGRCFPFQIIIKVNLEAQGVSGWWECPPHCFLGEPIFVDSKAIGSQEEDAGWVLVVMYDCGEGAGREVGGRGGAAAATAAGMMSAEQDMGPREIQGNNRPGRCSLLIFDAQNLLQGPVARAFVEDGFPLGFHTAFAADR